MNQKKMTIQELEAEYRVISDFLAKRWPLKDKQQQIFARIMKLVEELGELSDEILTSMNLARDSKIAKFSRENMEDELADVLASVVLLANELDVDIEKVMRKKIAFTRERFGIDKK